MRRRPWWRRKGAADPWRPSHLREEALEVDNPGGWGTPMASKVRCRGGGSRPGRKRDEPGAAGDAAAKPCPKPSHKGGVATGR